METRPDLSETQAAPALRPRQVLVLAQLPPPVHGVTATTQRIVHDLAEIPGVGIDQLWSGSARTLADVNGTSLAKLWRFALLNVRLAAMVAGMQRRDIVYVTLAPLAHTVVRDGIIACWGRLIGRRTLVHLHGEGLETAIEGSRFKVRVLRTLLRGTEVIAITSAAGAIAERSGIFARVLRMPNCAVDPGERTTNSRRPLRIGFLGNLDRRKGVLDFIETIARLDTAGPAVQAAIAGGSTRHMSNEDIAALISERGLADRISLLGPLYGEAKHEFLASLDLFLYPSAHDHAPLVLIEAMAHGAVPIVLDTGGIAEIVGAELAGNVLAAHLGPNDRVTAAARLVEAYRSDPAHVDHDRRRSRERFLSAFTEAHFRRALRDILELPPIDETELSARGGPDATVRLPLPAPVKAPVISLMRALHKYTAKRALPERIGIYFHSLAAPDRAALTECVGALCELGYRNVALDDYLDPATPGRLFTVSFDDNYVSWHRGLGLLDDLGIKATFYVNSLPFRDSCPAAEIEVYFARIGYRGEHVPLSRAELREIAVAGHGIGCHTHSHFMLAALEPAAWDREIRQSRDILEDIAGVPVRHFSWPYGMPRHITEAQKDYCLASGFRSIAGAAPAMLHQGPFDPRGVPRSEWRASRTRAQNLADLAIDGRLFTRLTGRSAIG